MLVSGRLFFIIVIYCSARSCASTGRHFLSLFGFRISERSALRKPIVYSPIIIIPTFSHKHNVNIQESESGNNYQQRGDVFQKLTTGKDEDLINNRSVPNTNQVSFNDSELQNDTESDIDPRDVANLKASSNATSEIITSANINETTAASISQETNVTEENVTAQTVTVRDPEGPYASSKYDNEFIKNLSLTTSAPQAITKFALPEDNDNWRMFATDINDNVSQYTTEDLNTEPKWNKLAMNNYFSGQFQPMAGLYHDGYLHKPLLNKQGFRPSHQNY